MIYTVTFNPCLDYTLRVPDFSIGKIHRTSAETIYPGGKGINVSIVLQRLGFVSSIWGFAGGFTGREIERLLTEQQCHVDFIWTKAGASRINVKIRSHEETDINGQGCPIDMEELTLLLERVHALTKEDILILAGSVPGSLPDDIYESILKITEAKGVRTIVDATGQLLTSALYYHPFLIKPNDEELGEIFHKTVSTEEEVIVCAKALQNNGAQNVLVSLGSRGAILLTQAGEVIRQKAVALQAANTVGAGDSMVAGFLAGYITSHDYKTALQWGSAAGSATASLPWLTDKKTFSEFLKQYTK